jgi:hypothetical protein
MFNSTDVDPAKVIIFVPKSFLGDEEVHVRAAPLYKYSPVIRDLGAGVQAFKKQGGD